MNQCIKLLIIAAIPVLIMQTSFASSAVRNTHSVNVQDDLKTLQNAWKAYKSNINAMNQALPSIKQERDVNKKNASISVHNQRLEHTKNILNQLILPQSAANQLRQQMIEHATKYQGVYRLAAIENLSTNQLNVFNRLDHQTTTLYGEMLNTANTILD